VDPQKALFLGRDANEKKIKETDLSRFRIVAFATHGLVPGAKWMTQPALRLDCAEVRASMVTASHHGESDDPEIERRLGRPFRL